jgi:hypothetical protein
VLFSDFAHEMEKWTDEQIIKRIVEILNKTHGTPEKPIPEPVKHKITRWYSDPYSRGSYSFMKVGSSKNDVNTLAECVGRVHFAGEATFVYPGYTHGGYMSGKREAKKITALIREQQEQQEQQSLVQAIATSLTVAERSGSLLTVDVAVTSASLMTEQQLPLLPRSAHAH